MHEPIPRKALGQHWLYDEKALQAIADAAQLTPDDTVLEIGPGLGTLTKLLVQTAKNVVAVEFDRQLAADLLQRVPVSNLQVVQQDILHFDLTSLPSGYKVVANIPYYLTSNLIRVLSESANPPVCAVLLVQKEVAERLVAAPGALSLLGVSAQWYWQVTLGIGVPAKLFTPPPKVDSQVVVLARRSLPANVDARALFRIVRAGFSQRRKTLLNSLSAGLHLGRDETAQLLQSAHLDPSARAQTLSLAQWQQLYESCQKLL